MEIEFASDELKDLINDPEKLKEKFGDDVAEKIGQAIQALSEAETFSDIDELLEDSEHPKTTAQCRLPFAKATGSGRSFPKRASTHQPVCITEPRAAD